MNQKRASDSISDNDTSKRANFDIWAKDEILTPPSTPSTPSVSKYDFNIWSNAESVEKSPVNIADLKFGYCLERPMYFRVSFKSKKRAGKNGDWFYFYIMNGEEEIQITVFAQETVTYFDDIKFNHAYEMVNFNVKKEDKDFPLFIGKGTYLSLLKNSKIKLVDDETVPKLHFNFGKIADFDKLPINTKCDCIAVVARNWGFFVVGDNKMKREVSITDDSKGNILLTLWGREYEKFDHCGCVVLIHNGVIGEYMGKRVLNCSPNTLFWHVPDVEGVDELKVWYENELLKMKRE